MGVRQVIIVGALLAGIIMYSEIYADTSWSPLPSELSAPDLSGDNLLRQWPQLTRSTQDIYPTADILAAQVRGSKTYADYLLKQLKSAADKPGASVQATLDKNNLAVLASELQDIWRAHFQGDFEQAKRKGLALGTTEARYVAYRAQTIYALYLSPTPSGELKMAERPRLLKEVADILKEEQAEMDKAGVVPSGQLIFWQNYAYARYVEIMKPVLGMFEKKAAVTAVLDGLEQVFGMAAAMPALHGLFGGTFAAVYEDGFMARTNFVKRLKMCNGTKTSDYELAVQDHFNCAISELGAKPFPEVYASYGDALERLNRKRRDNYYQSRVETYYQFAMGSQVPDGVTGMTFSAEDALAQHAAKKY